MAILSPDGISLRVRWFQKVHGELNGLTIHPKTFISRLAIFPAPPAKGGISVTNEDQFCLNDGEFLNDVIIDFYLK